MAGEAVEQGNERERDTKASKEEVGAVQPAEEIPAPAFYAPPLNPIASTSTTTTHSRSYSHSRTRSKHLTPMDMTFFTLPASDPHQEASPTLRTTGTASSEGMLAGRRKREALRPIQVQERGTAFGSGGDVAVGLGLGLGLGMSLGGGDVQPEAFSMPLSVGEKEKGMCPLRGSPRVGEHKKRRSFNFKKTVPLHRHSGSADSLRKLGSGFGYGCKPPGSITGLGHEEEERGIRTAPARLEGALLVHAGGASGLEGMGEPFSIPSYGTRMDKDEEKTSEADVGLEMPGLEMAGLDFAMSMEVDADQEGETKPFSFPQRRTFGFPQAEAEDEQSVSVLPEVAVVPSTPAWDEFSLPPFDSSSPGKASGSAFSPAPEQGAKKRFQGFKFGQPAPAQLDEPTKPTMPAFSFGKKLEPVVVVKPNTVPDEGPSSAMSMPSLPSTPTRKKRHSHTRSGSVSSYHAFMPSNTGIPVAPRSPGMLSIEPMPRSSSPSGRLSPTPSSPVEGFGVVSPVKAPGDIKLDREGALRTLEGARSGLASGSTSTSNLTWPMPGVDGLFGRDGRPLSASGLGAQGKRRSRKSLMMEKAQQETHEVQIPDLDSDEETLDVSSPNPFNSAPPSPRPLSGIISAPASTRDSFDRMFKAPPAATAPGFGLTLAPTIGASVEPHLNTLVEEEEPEEEEQDATTPRAMTAASPPPTSSLQLRPLRLGSMSFDSFSSSGRLADPEDSWSADRHSTSFERDRSSSVGSNPLSPSSSSEVSMQRSSSGTDEPMRIGRRPRSWIGRGKRASVVSLSGSIQTLNEVPESADLEESMTTPQAAESRIVIPPGVRTRRRRSATAHSIALGSFEDCEDVALLREKLADAAMERVAMEQDIQDWRGRCGDLEKQLRNERQQSGVLRDRVRRRKLTRGGMHDAMTSWLILPFDCSWRSSLSDIVCGASGGARYTGSRYAQPDDGFDA